ncbi:carboxypeptidase regulatory-like domain-containing protein [Telmatobacter sp. DSM 110680]|uniref:Carboxypeptidase regulatory-like domain-containing protein n=1 Tax=Telmatobacter sp. DSM 110680 TaxID=3036704 RepID=A0AAU7DMT4_9BACT
MTLSKRILAVFLALWAGVAVAGAQTSNGTVIGAITDSLGASIVGATVTITSVDTGAVRTTVTNQEGTYRIEAVLPGTYNVSASASGFETTVNKGLIVPGTAIVSASLVLKVGSASDKVEVSADNAVLNTDNGQIAGTISEQEISSLPIASLNPYELALTLPGVMNTQVGGFSNGVDFNVGGGRPRANNFLIEGQDNNDAGIQGQGLQPGNDEAVKEVVIIENAYTAEYGHGAGSVSNLIYKSGTNDWHGAVYERLQNSSLDTVDKNEILNGITTVNKYRENQPGFRVGGPIIHNKLFGFASYQWDFYRSTANLAQLTVPTAAGFATLGNYSSNTRVANLIKAYGGLVGTNGGTKITPPAIALGPDPVTGVDRGTVEMGTVERNLGADDNAPEIDLKGDYIMSDKDTLNLRFIRTRFTAPYDVFNFTGQLPGFDSDQDGTSYNTGLVESHVFNPHVVNEARLSYSRIGFSFGLPGSTLANPLYNQPAVSVSNMTGYGIPGNIPQGRFHNTYQLQDTISWTHGKHFIKVGEDIADTRVKDQIPFNFYGAIGFTNDTSSTTVPGPGGVGTQSVKYTGLANLIDDFGGPNTTVTQNFGSPIAQPRLFSQNYFVQDTYRPIPTLSLDLGFRYEYNGAPFNATGTPYPGIDVTNPACFPLTPGASCKTKQIADGNQWGPRAGIAWSPTLFGQNKTVIRSGFGVFYDVVFTNIIDNIQATAPNAASPVITSSATANGHRGTGSWYEQFANLNQTPKPTNTAEPIVDHLLSPRTLHWNLNVEQELPWATTIQVGYVGERGEHLYGNTNLNPYVNDTLSAARVIPTRGSIVIRDNSDDSEYTGLWSELDHKFNHQFLFRASYTLGRAFDDGSEIFTTANESSYQFSRYPTPRGTTDWGPSEYDHRQRLVLAYIWTPSVWHTEGAMKVVGNVVNHWALAGITQFQSGTTHNVEVGYDGDGDGISNDRPMLGNKHAPVNTYAFDDSWFYGVSQGTLCSGPSFWYTNNPCEVVSPDQVHWIVGPYGSHPTNPIGRNSYIGPGYQQWDMNVQRSFKIHEKLTMDFRGELFNVFNHGQVDTNGYLENSTLISGIPTDAYTGDNGTNTFESADPVVNGHRHARLFIRFQF